MEKYKRALNKYYSIKNENFWTFTFLNIIGFKEENFFVSLIILEYLKDENNDKKVSDYLYNSEIIDFNCF